jgi:hypothetical protein
MFTKRLAFSLATALTFVLGLGGCGGGGGAAKKPATPPVVKDDTSTAKPATTPEDKGEAAAPAGAEEGWGTIKGQVVWSGDVAEPELRVKKGDANVKDAAVCAVNDIPKEDLVVNKENKGLRWVLVYIGGKPKIHPDLATAEGEAELDQENCRFIPHLLAMRAGQKFVISSNDPIAHNTKGDGFRNQFNPTVPAADPGSKKSLPPMELQPENLPIAISCSIHTGFMYAWVAVLNHPYFAVTDENGNFEIKNVPAGAQKLVVWHEKGWGDGLGKGQGKEITVKAGDTTDLGEIGYAPEKK